MTASFNIYQVPAVDTPIGLVQIKASAINKYRVEHVRVTRSRKYLSDEESYDSIKEHLKRGRLMYRKNAVAQALRHRSVARYMVDDLWVMVLSRDNKLLDIYRKDFRSQITEYYLPLNG